RRCDSSPPSLRHVAPAIAMGPTPRSPADGAETRRRRPRGPRRRTAPTLEAPEKGACAVERALRDQKRNLRAIHSIHDTRRFERAKYTLKGGRSARSARKG